MAKGKRRSDIEADIERFFDIEGSREAIESQLEWHRFVARIIGRGQLTSGQEEYFESIRQTILERESKIGDYFRIQLIRDIEDEEAAKIGGTVLRGTYKRGRFAGQSFRFFRSSTTGRFIPKPPALLPRLQLLGLLPLPLLRL